MEISAVLITFNEEKRLEPALKSVQGLVSEIIVVDSHSTDDTVRIARRYTEHVYERKWTNFADQKNFANAKASYPWILSLDADERVSPELGSEILSLADGEPDLRRILRSPPGPLPRPVDPPLRLVPGPQGALFRKDRARWEGDYVHESLVFDGRIERLKGAIHHFTYDTSPSTWPASTSSRTSAPRSFTQEKKRCRLVHLLGWPAGRFLKSYVLKLGFLDGFPGLVISVLNGYSIFIRYAKLREIWKKGERIEPFPY